MKIKTYFNKITCAGITALLLASFTTEALASTAVIRDAEEKAEEAQENLGAVNSQIGNIEAEQAALREEMAALDADLTNVVLNITLLEGELTNTRAELDQVSNDLTAAQQKESTEYNDMKKRIRYMYENGDQTLWSALLGSDGISDLLNRIEYVETVYKYDRNLLNQYQDTVAQVTELKHNVQEEEAELEEIEVELVNQQAVLEATIAEKQKENEDFSAQLANAQALADQYAATIAQQNEIIRAEQKRIEEEEARKKAEEEKRKAEAELKKKEEEEKKKKQEQQAQSGTSGGTDDSGSSAGGDQGGTAGSGSSEESSSGGGDNTGSGSNPGYTTGVSGQAVVDYACQFLGNPYVYGGTSLTNGTDCSGFTQGVFAHFGISLPRTSYEQSQVGQSVSYDCAQPGDIVYYTGHVGIYMGGGQIINASTPATGIKIQSATYRPIVTIRRVL